MIPTAKIMATMMRWMQFTKREEMLTAWEQQIREDQRQKCADAWLYAEGGRIETASDEATYDFILGAGKENQDEPMP